MSKRLKIHKVISSLPSTLEPDALYFVRVGQGFDLYLTDTTGSVAYSINSSSPEKSVPLPGAVPRPYGINDYLVPYAVGGTAGTTLALTANRIYWIPVYMPSCTITEVAINVITAATGIVNVGIYNTNSNLQPNSLIYSSIDFNTGTTGLKTYTNSFTISQSGVYWFALFTSGTATLRAVALAAGKSLALADLGTANTLYWTTSNTSLPNTAPTSGYARGSTAIPAIGLRVSF